MCKIFTKAKGKPFLQNKTNVISLDELYEKILSTSELYANAWCRIYAQTAICSHWHLVDNYYKSEKDIEQELPIIKSRLCQIGIPEVIHVVFDYFYTKSSHMPTTPTILWEVDVDTTPIIVENEMFLKQKTLKK